LWIYNKTLKIENQKHKDLEVIILDSEGLEHEGPNYDIKILLLAVLLSSFLIYNSIGPIDEK